MPFIIEKERDPLYKDGLEVGMEKGLEKGIEKGKKEQMVASAKKMLAQKLDIDLIAQVTSLSIEEIKKLDTTDNNF